MNYADTPVSFFTSYSSTTPSTVTLSHIHQLLTIDGHLKELTDQCRYYNSIQDTDRASRAKRSCPAFTPAVVCVDGRRREHIQSYTFLTLCDIDAIPTDRMSDAIRLIDADPHTLLCHITVRGHGLHILAPYTLSSPTPWDKLTPQQQVQAYQQAFTHVNTHYAQLTGLECDLKCSNPERLFGLCHDPHTYFNPDASPFTLISASPKPPRSPKSSTSKVDRIGRLVQSNLASSGVVYQEGSYNTYLSKALYQLNRYGIPEPQALQWAQTTYPDYAPASVASICQSVYSHTDEFNTWSPTTNRRSQAQPHQATPAEIQAYLSAHTLLRMNLIRNQVEIATDPQSASPQYTRLTDFEVNSLWSEMSVAGIHCNRHDLYAVLNSRFVPTFHPFQHYLSQLAPWDGVGDPIGELAARITLTEPCQYFTAYFRRWFVGLLAGWLHPDHVNQTILVLIGRQGIYKTQFFRHLLPPELRDYFFTKTDSSHMTKDDKLALTEYGLVCLEELDSLKPSELNILKSLVTQSFINERPAYARYKETRKHVSSFCGTGNTRLFLTDTTGNRRWLPFEVESILSPFDHPIDYPRLYAQALHLYESGFNYWFTLPEIIHINQHNADYAAPCLETELIWQYFRRPREGETGKFMSTAAILERISLSIRQPLSPRIVSATMKRLGFRPGRQGNIRGYFVIERRPTDPQPPTVDEPMP